MRSNGCGDIAELRGVNITETPLTGFGVQSLISQGFPSAATV